MGGYQISWASQTGTWTRPQGGAGEKTREHTRLGGLGEGCLGDSYSS